MGWTKQREVNPDQADRELAHKAGVKQGSPANSRGLAQIFSVLFSVFLM